MRAIAFPIFCLGLTVLPGLVAQTSGSTQAVSVAQSSPAALSPAAKASLPVAVDPLLTKPVESVTPEQVHQMQQKLSDWPQLGRYRESNAALPAAEPGRVVFFGNSITEGWGRDNTVFFPGKPYVNRGIGGQTTPQMVIRMQQDVVALKPAAVLILAGTNDLAGNNGLSTLGMIEDNFRSMTAIAQTNHIRVILASILPAADYPWRPGLEPAPKIRALNMWLKQFAAEQNCTYLDYYTALADQNGGMKPGTSKDGVHPTAAGYAIMAPLAQAAIDTTLKQ